MIGDKIMERIASLAIRISLRALFAAANRRYFPNTTNSIARRAKTTPECAAFRGWEGAKLRRG
jgi:hypothetical protein